MNAHAELPDDRLVPVLLVEDNLLNQELVIELLYETEYAVTVAENGIEAVDLFRATPFSVVLMDLQMPVMDGLAATRAIRELERERGVRPTPVIALTGNATVYDREQAMDAGCDDFLAKPFDLDVFMVTLSRWVRKTASGG